MKTRILKIGAAFAIVIVMLAAVLGIYVLIGSREPQHTVEQRSRIDANMTRLLDGLPAPIPDLTTFPVTVENCGRKLTFEQPPSRVVGLWQPSNELLLALGVQNNVIAFGGMYDKLPVEFEAAAGHVPTLGSILTLHIPNREQMIAAQPDLIVTEGLNTFVFDAAQGFATVAEIEDTGAQIISTGSICDHTEDSSRGTSAVYEDLHVLGVIFGVSERAEELIRRLKARENAVLAAVKDHTPVRVAFYNGDTEKIYVLSSAVWNDLMTKAGGVNVFKNTKISGELSPEAFASIDADVILYGIFPQNGVFPGRNADVIKEHLKKTFPNIPAVRNDRLHPIPTIVTEASVRFVDGLEMIAHALHPEAFQ
jgi:iron complex transport system substrate-binding protein